MKFLLMFGVMLISTLYIVCFVLLRVDEQATKEPKTQQVVDPEQELAEGMLCP